MKKYIRIMMNIIYIMMLMSCSITNTEKVDSTKNVKNSITQLLDADYNKKGFIVIEGKTQLEYIQFGLESYGLMLMWPLVENKNKGISEINRVKLYLNNKNYEYKKINNITRKDILELKKREYVQDSEGIYSNFGNNSEEITEMIKYLFETVYGYNNFNNMKIELVVDNL